MQISAYNIFSDYLLVGCLVENWFDSELYRVMKQLLLINLGGRGKIWISG